ncbi:hypothetical protein PIROE2DRAFT_10654 [Piromyces sp. E2]|nr:hypothetical protein PIROE2DRAFT_10654 [Piromyces sp. E2]|eukprot:OUM62909.1 hypothetical protein PIROE2DRAFT_10654 [Piromyces sp. E2]
MAISYIEEYVNDISKYINIFDVFEENSGVSEGEKFKIYFKKDQNTNILEKLRSSCIKFTTQEQKVYVASFNEFGKSRKINRFNNNNENLIILLEDLNKK